MEFHFSTNRAEAERWLSTAVKLLTTRDLHGTKSFAIRARESDPRLEATEQIIAVADTLLAADSMINGLQQPQPDWYAILQLGYYTQDLELVATQYRRLALLLNPLRNRFPYAEHAFRLVSEAWNVLSNPSKKALYDHEISTASFHRFDSAPPAESTQLFERQFLQMHHVQQHQQPPPPQSPQPPPQIIYFHSQPPPPPPPQQLQQEVSHHQQQLLPQWCLQQQPQPQYQESPRQQQHQQQLPRQQQPVRKNPRGEDGRAGMEDERPSWNNVAESAPPPPPDAVPTRPAELAARPSEPTRSQPEPTGSGSFWTACPYCYNLFEYPSGYEECMLRCQNCKRAFNAVVIESPPVTGTDVNFCCWGYFPLGLTEGFKDTGGSAEWSPFSTMFACPIQGRKKNAGRPKNSGPWVYIDDDVALLDVSEESSGDSDDEWERGRTKRRVVKAKGKASPVKAPVRASARIKKGIENAGGQGKVGNGGNSGGGGSESKAESSKKPSGGGRKRGEAALGKLDLNVEFSNNEVEEPAAQTMSEGNGTANGEEDNMEGIGFFEGLDEFLSSLPILNVVGDDKVKAN